MSFIHREKSIGHALFTVNKAHMDALFTVNKAWWALFTVNKASGEFVSEAKSVLPPAPASKSVLYGAYKTLFTRGS